LIESENTFNLKSLIPEMQSVSFTHIPFVKLYPLEAAASIFGLAVMMGE